ncbi:MAG TPA: adenylyltransferase/cytidyltransferase family protein, partial [Rectinemataceae bacterium]
MKQVFVSGIFDDIRSKHLRFLQEASLKGEVTVFLWSDEAAMGATGKAPRFGLAERRYYLEAVRWVSRVKIVDAMRDPEALPQQAVAAAQIQAAVDKPIWIVTGAFGHPTEGPSAAKAAFCAKNGIDYLELGPSDLSGFPYEPLSIDAPRRIDAPRAPKASSPPGASGTSSASCEKRVVVTGCFDWLHTGHVRFFEEASAYGELTVVVGHDENIRLLKGEGHPLFSQEERQYVVGSIRHVARALVSSGSGWLDAEPEIIALKADRYIVNADGDKPEK